MSMQLGEATIQRGLISDDVRNMQKILAGQGYNVGVIDGNFGPQTEAAVRAFQSTKGLVPDGIVGPLTWDALRGKTSETFGPPAPVLQPAPMAPQYPKTFFSTPLAGNLPLYIGVGLLGMVMLTQSGGSPKRRTRRRR